MNEILVSWPLAQATFDVKLSDVVELAAGATSDAEVAAALKGDAGFTVALKDIDGRIADLARRFNLELGDSGTGFGYRDNWLVVPDDRATEHVAAELRAYLLSQGVVGVEVR